MRHVVTDHAILHSFFVILVEIFENDPTNGLDRLPPVLGQLGKVLFDGGRFALHGSASFGLVILTSEYQEDDAGEKIVVTSGRTTAGTLSRPG